MQDIDFLPIEHRIKRERRKAQPLQLAITATVIGMVSAAAMIQHQRWIHVRKELTSITPAYQQAVQMEEKLVEVKKRLDRSRAQAELCTYLRHPWPRSQLLSALITPLPDSVAFQGVQIFREPRAPLSPDVDPSRDEKQGGEENRGSSTPSERDLKKLHDMLDPMRTFVVLDGTVAGSSVLYHYLGGLDETDYFENARLDCLNRLNEGSESYQFRATLTVRPGYGQPGGPERPEIQNIAKAAPRQPKHGDSKP
jgi:hypothetical protein